MKKIIPLLFLALLLTHCSEEKKLLRKASNAVEVSDYDKALGFYDKLVQKDKNSFYGNAGKGIVLSEYMARHEQAIPYLEQALKNVPKKSETVINGDLGKSYHFIGNYKRALYYYSKISDKNGPEFSDYDEFLNKRIADCRYALEHPKVALPENQSLSNVGNVINTEKPEYTPVFTNGKLFFTSKRQDTPKEKKNGEDGKYFESIYVSEVKDNSTFSTPQLYKIPETGFHLRKYGEAAISASPDGKKLYVYKGGKIYETDIENPSQKPEKLDDKINFAMSNHACLSPDGKTMYFAAEDSKNGRGGTDLYVTSRNDDGTWADPKILSNVINTSADEDAPFINEQGVLFFASNGHPGYGGFDVYKTKLMNGEWMSAENLGQPINSAGDDIYFTLKSNSSNGYYASARPGGFGDLDIYKVHYVSTETTECKPDSTLVINSTANASNPLVQNIELTVPESYKNNVRSYRWEVNGEEIAQTSEKFQHTFAKADTYKVSARLVVYCDTCPTLIGRCAVKTIELAQPVLTSNDKNGNNSADKNALANNKNSKNKNSKNGKGKNANNNSQENVGADNSANDNNNDAASNSSSKNKNNKKGKNAGNDNASENGNDVAANGKNNSGNNNNNSQNNAASDADNNTYAANTYLNDNELKAINWNATPAYFNYNEATLSAEAKELLASHAQILKEKKGLFVTINAYTDSRGSNEYNQVLSQRRANSVKQFLVEKGIPAKRIKAKGHGETDLVNNCSDGITCDDNQHQQNRRVIVKVSQGPVKDPSSITQN